MEAIKQALERARRERQGAAPAQPGRNPAGPLSEQQITYTHTRAFGPDLHILRGNRVIAGNDADPIVDAYKVLRTQVLQRLRVEGWNSLAITSPGEGQGKTLTAINLAISLAREVNHTVLLADFDLRRPHVHQVFGIEPKAGLSDFLLNDMDLGDILITPGIERLVILPGGTPLAHSSEMLSSPRMVSLVDELKTRYDSRLLLFDLPPLLSSDDVLAFLPQVDAVILVVQERKTRRDEVTRSIELLKGTPLLGTVLNDSAQPGSRYYY